MSSPETINPDAFRGMQLSAVIAADQTLEKPVLRLGKRSVERFEAAEAEAGEEGLFFVLASRVHEGISLRSMATQLNLDAKMLGRVLKAAGIDYPNREEAVQRLWRNEEFRIRNAQALAESTNRGGWSNPEYRARILPKKREVMQRLKEDPEFTRRNREAIRKANRDRWQNPEERRVQSERQLARWEDPEYRAAHREMMLARWKDPDYRERQTQALRERTYDPETLDGFRARGSAILKALWQNPEFRANQIERSRAHMNAMRQNPEFVEAGIEASKLRLLDLWQDPEYRERMSQQNQTLWNDPDRREAASRKMQELWEDPNYRSPLEKARRQQAQSQSHREHFGEASRARWKDPEYREAAIQKRTAAWKDKWEKDPDFKNRILTILDQARNEPTRRERLVLPTIYGYRSDIGFNANSAWEANIARVLTHIGRDFITRQDLELVPMQEYAHLFNSMETTLTVDFVTIDNRDRFVIYEIMAHPLKDPIGWAKFVLAKEQYPQFRFVAITEEMYKRIEDRFEDRINGDARFHGWENRQDNLKTNPLKYTQQI